MAKSGLTFSLLLMKNSLPDKAHAFAIHEEIPFSIRLL
jgi:hypothetical protein